MATNLLDDLKKAMKAVFGDLPVKVIIARDDDVNVVITDDDVRLWNDAEQTSPFITLTNTHTYHFNIIGWPVRNKKGNVMVPVLWRRQKVWLNKAYAKEESL